MLIVPSVSFAQGLFKEVDKKDEFGDVIGTKLSYSDKANKRIVIAGNESENSNYKKD